MTSRRSTPTIADVARAAGVSPTTVSFVLNDRVDHGIPEGTSERVRLAARDIGYRPNAAAKSLRTRQTHTIGFISDEIASTPFAGQMIQGAQDAAWERGKVLLIVNTGDNPEIRDKAVDMMLDRQVEGIILASYYHRKISVPASLTRQVPVVLLDCFADDGEARSVMPDEVGGGRTATEELIRAGHRRIGFINLGHDLAASHGRLAGYKAALAANDLPFDESLVRWVEFQVPAAGYHAAQELLSLPEPPTALFCGNDRAAMEAYEAIKERGLRVPQDVSVIGFDNMALISAHLRPALSSVALPHYEMGRWAIESLTGGTSERAETGPNLMPCPLVRRESVAQLG